MGETKPHAYTEAKVEVPRLLADVVCNFIIENISSGLVLEEEEDTLITEITFYIPQDDKKNWRSLLTGYLSHLVNGSGAVVPSIRERLIENVEWEEQYRQSVKPVFISEDIVIRPPWHAAEPGVKYDIVIEPKMAFGTGRHETTRSCLKIVRERFKSGMRFLDVGCGSGVLSILADKMGASFIKAIDNDPTAVGNCRENFKANRVFTPSEIMLGSIEKGRGDLPYDFICANIIKSTILSMLSDLAILTADKGILVLSGLLDRDEGEVSACLDQAGLTTFSILRDNEWLTYAVVKG
jgi:ribosomal protein L11 methyltransferase